MEDLDASCTKFEGELILTDLDVVQAEYTCLRTIDETLEIVDNGVLVSLSFPKLTTIAGSLVVEGNAKLRTLNFPELTTVGESLEIAGNAELKAAMFPKLTTVVDGGVEVLENHASLGTCSSD